MRSKVLAALLTVICIVSGCSLKTRYNTETTAAPTSAQSPDARTRTRNNSLSLLYKLVSDEQHVSKLLLIKKERQQLHDLIKKISERAAAITKSLEGMAKADATIDLKVTSLPAGEEAAREIESKNVTSELLRSKGADFEFTLLFTQAEALRYGSNLATIAAANDLNPDRRKQLTDAALQFRQLGIEVVRLMRGIK